MNQTFWGFDFSKALKSSILEEEIRDGGLCYSRETRSDLILGKGGGPSEEGLQAGKIVKSRRRIT